MPLYVCVQRFRLLRIDCVLAEWTERLQALKEHLEREHTARSSLTGLPDEVQALPFWREVSGKLGERLGVPFWTLYRPNKHERCLYIGCGPSFLTDPWVEWEAYFYGLDLRPSLVQAVRSRAPQLNGKLFKSLEQGAPHDLGRYPEGAFDLVIVAGFSPYFPIAYSEQVLDEIGRVLKAGGNLLWEVVDPDARWFEDWSIGQMYRGLEVYDTTPVEWQALLATRGTIKKELAGELFRFYLVQWGGA